MTSFKTISTLLIALFLGLGLSGKPVHAKAVEGVVNVNTASVQELTMLPGIGKAKAEQIVQLRQSKPFSSPDELKAIKGLGAKRLEALRPHLSFSGATTAKAIKAPKASVQPAGTTSAPQASNSVPGKI